jgi:hypothetical protein
LIRSVGLVKFYTKENFKEALYYIVSSLQSSVDEYSNFYVKNIILFYNICYEDSLNNEQKERILKNLNQSQTKTSLTKNKDLLKISDKNLPLITDLTQ